MKQANPHSRQWLALAVALAAGVVASPAWDQGGSLAEAYRIIAAKQFVDHSSVKASLSTSSLAVGKHSITATFNGSANYLSSTSSTLTQTVI